MGQADFYRSGDFNVICDRCGFKRKASDTRKEWTGLRVCSDTCWEDRHPQDFVRAHADRQQVHDPRPEPNDQILGTGDVTYQNIDTASASGTPIQQSGESFLSANEVTEDDL